MAVPKKARSPPKPPSIPAPSASVVVISPQNEILLLHRVQTGTFSSAHVFPGGNLSDFHEGSLIPAVGSAERHTDGPSYRLAAIRETFEESGVLLARPSGQAATSAPHRDLLQVSEEDSRRGRLGVANEKLRFEEWLSSVGGIPDSDNLIPFTRWLTPPNLARRYTTQMYLYVLPLVDKPVTETREAGSSPGRGIGATQPTADLTEVMAAEFASASTWVRRAQKNEIILFPPQLYILSLLAPLLRGPEDLPAGTSAAAAAAHYAAGREKMAELVSSGPAEGEDQTTFVPWADRVISPRAVGKLPDGRVVMALDQPGLELRDSGRGGDAHRVVLVGNMPPGPPRDIELRLRDDVMPALAAAKAKAAKAQAVASAGDGASKL